MGLLDWIARLLGVKEALPTEPRREEAPQLEVRILDGIRHVHNSEPNKKYIILASDYKKLRKVQRQFGIEGAGVIITIKDAGVEYLLNQYVAISTSGETCALKDNPKLRGALNYFFLRPETRGYNFIDFHTHPKHLIERYQRYMSSGDADTLRDGLTYGNRPLKYEALLVTNKGVYVCTFKRGEIVYQRPTVHTNRRPLKSVKKEKEEITKTIKKIQEKIQTIM